MTLDSRKRRKEPALALCPITASLSSAWASYSGSPNPTTALDPGGLEGRRKKPYKKGLLKAYVPPTCRSFSATLVWAGKPCAIHSEAQWGGCCHGDRAHLGRGWKAQDPWAQHHWAQHPSKLGFKGLKAPRGYSCQAKFPFLFLPRFQAEVAPRGWNLGFVLLGSAVAEELEIHLDCAQTARSSAWLLAETPLRPRFEPTPLEPSLLPPPAVGSAGCTGPPTLLLLLLLWHIPYFMLSAPRLGVNTAGVGSSPARDAEVLHGMP